MTPQIVTPQFLIERIDSFLQEKVSTTEFGHEIIGYLAFEDQYILEKDHEQLLVEVLSEFMDLHDVGQENIGYEPYIPSYERIIELKGKLKKAIR